MAPNVTNARLMELCKKHNFPTFTVDGHFFDAETDACNVPLLTPVKGTWLVQEPSYQGLVQAEERQNLKEMTPAEATLALLKGLHNILSADA